MIIRKLTIDDLDLLIKLRIDFLLDEKIEFSIEELKDIKQKSKEFFIATMESNSFLAFAAELENEIVSTAFLTISERPPRKAFIPFRVGTIYNVFTYENHRRKGIATKILTKLLNEAKSMSVCTVDLWATPDGEELYKKLGFWSIDLTPMRKEL